MKKIWIVILMLIVSILFPTAQVRAQEGLISLEEGNIILSNSYVELVSSTDSQFFALVRISGKAWIYSSSDQGKTWQRNASQGLPDTGKFLTLKTPSQNIIVLATASAIYLSRDSGKTFEFLGGPSGLTDRGEQITSMAATSGNPPVIAIGVWHPQTGKFPLEGVYAWGLGGSRWEPQGMHRTWSGKGYNADVTAIDFMEGNLLVLATGDPDNVGSLPEGTYLNIGVPSAGKTFDAAGNWNFVSGWPIEIPQGQSPKESEILSARIASDFSLQEQKIYLYYATRQGTKDDVFLITFSENMDLAGEELRQLMFPTKAPVLVSFDSLAYTKGLLAIGVTVMKEGVKSGQVFYLTTAEERAASPYWNSLFSPAKYSYNPQIILLPDGTVFVGSVGPSSSFAKVEVNSTKLTPISLIDASGGIYQTAILPKEKTAIFNYGDKNIFKFTWNTNY